MACSDAAVNLGMLLVVCRERMGRKVGIVSVAGSTCRSAIRAACIPGERDGSRFAMASFAHAKDGAALAKAKG